MAVTTIGYMPDKKSIANDKRAFKDRVKETSQKKANPDQTHGDDSCDKSNGKPDDEAVG